MRANYPKNAGTQNMAAVLQQAQKMQEEMAAKEEELAGREYEISAGGGAVKQLCAQQGICLPQPLQPGLGFNAAVGAQLLGTLQSLSYSHLITSFL